MSVSVSRRHSLTHALPHSVSVKEGKEEKAGGKRAQREKRGFGFRKRHTSMGAREGVSTHLANKVEVQPESILEPLNGWGTAMCQSLDQVWPSSCVVMTDNQSEANNHLSVCVCVCCVCESDG